MDTENTPEVEVAPQTEGTQSEQVASTETEATPPQAAEETEKLYAGKYKSAEEMEKAYIEAQSKMTQLAQEKSILEKMTERVSERVSERVAPVEEASFEPETEQAVRAAARKEWDEMERQKFLAKHGEELKENPVLAGTVRELIARENNAGRFADRESVLQQAKEMLEKQIKPVVKEAQTQGFKEAQQKAQLKNQAGAVGNTNYKEPVLDDSSLSAEELRKKFNVPRI